MKPIIYTRLGVITLLCCCSSIVLAEALIIEDGTVNAQIEVLDEYQAEQERLKALINNQPPAYVDKVMKQGNLTSDSETVDDRTQPEGLRSYYLESRMYTRDSNNLANASTSTNDWTLRGEYRQQTLNYGEWIAQGEIHNQTIDNTAYEDKKSKQNRLTLLNHDLPLTSAIKADSALGDFNGGITESLERQARFSLGNSNVRGVGTRIKGETFELRAGSGKRGVWESTPYASFRESQGTLQWLGYSKELSKNINTGLQYNRATQVKSNDTELTTTLDSLAATINYQPKATETRSTQARLTGVKSKSLEGKTSQGLFAEGAFYQGHYYHEWGTFFSEPDLYFGNNLLADDNRGGYWRTSYHSSHLNTGMGIDIDETPATIENAGNKRVSLNVNAQKRLDLNNTLSGNITYHHNDYDQVNGNSTKAQSLNTHLSYERKTAHNGTTRLNLQLGLMHRQVAKSLVLLLLLSQPPVVY